jgi:hypothetical protein
MTTLFHDENIFHIRSFHASRRREPNSIDVLCAYYFLGCLILFIYCLLIFVSFCVLRLRLTLLLLEDIGFDLNSTSTDS